MKCAIFLAFVICITIVNAKPSGTSEQNSDQSDSFKTDPLYVFAGLLEKQKPPRTTTEKIGEDEISVKKLIGDGVQLIFLRIGPMVRQLAEESIQNPKSILRRRFRKRFPTCEQAVVNTMARDVFEKIRDREPPLCYSAVEPLVNTLRNISQVARENLIYFKSHKHETVNDDVKNAKREEIRRMENQMWEYKESRFESETLGLNNCFKNFVSKIMDQWKGIVVPEDGCKTSEDYHLRFHLNDIAAA